MPVRITNVQAGYYDKHGFHPLRQSVDYDPERAGDDYSSRRDATGLAYDRSSKRKRAHRFVRGAAVNPGSDTGWKAISRQTKRLSIEGLAQQYRGLGYETKIVSSGKKAWVLYVRRSGGARVNPKSLIPSRWTPAKVMRTKRGEVKVMLSQPRSVGTTRRRARNIAAGFYDEEGVFHPIRASRDYSPGRVGEKKKKKRRGKK